MVQMPNDGQTKDMIICKHGWRTRINFTMYTHNCAVGGVIEGFDDFELVKHLAHHHDAGPHSRDAGCHRS